MRKYNIPPAFSGSLQLGRQGENGVTEITFLCAGYAKMYGDGFAEAVHRTPDGTTYPVNIEQDENNRVSWLISDGDTATAGTGQLELRWMVNGNLAKSKIFSTIIKSALTAPETPPDAAKSWVDKVLKAAEDIQLSGITEQKAREIAQSVVDAHQEKDPTVPDWAKAETKPTYTAAEVGAVPESAKSDIDKNTSARHTHSNKSALDSISESDIAKWNSGTAGTVEITGATSLAAGSAPTVTETADSTAQARKYTLGIPAGADGKSAYQFAQEAGYTGTETDFSKKLNQATFANPFPLTFTGATSATYDGSAAVTVDLQSGGSSQDIEVIKQDIFLLKRNVWNAISDGKLDNTGVVDCAEIVQKAIDDAKPCTVLYFPKGSYLFKNNITINQKKGLTIKGDGTEWYGTLFVASYSGTFIQFFGGSNLKIEDLSLKGNDNPASRAIAFRDNTPHNMDCRTTDTCVQHVVITHFAYGIDISCPSGYNYFDNVRVSLFPPSEGIGFSVGKDYNNTGTTEEGNTILPNYVYFTNCKAGGSSKGFTVDALRVTCGQYIVIDKCDFCNSTNGVRLLNNGQNYTILDVFVNNTSLYNNENGVLINAKSDGISRVSINNCMIVTSAGKYRYALAVLKDDAVKPVTNISFIGNIFRDFANTQRIFFNIPGADSESIIKIGLGF